MRICAVILNYFGLKDTVACCESLIGQDVERIVLVENSASLDQLQALERLYGRSMKVQVLAPGKNLGFAAGVNYALRRMIPHDFEAFLLINNDTIPPADLIEKLCRGLISMHFDIASPVIYCHPERHRLWSQGNYYNIWTGIITHKPLPLPGNFFYLPGCCLLINWEVFNSVGLFDEDFFMYGEDVEFCFRAVKNRFRLGVVREATVYHKTGHASSRNLLLYEEHIAKAHLLLARKIVSPEKSALVLFFKITILMLRAFYRGLQRGNIVALKGCLRAIRKEYPNLRLYQGRDLGGRG